jgi:transposase InsO family protein
MTGILQREQIIGMVAQAVTSGARQHKACQVIGLSERTLQRWQSVAGAAGDRRASRVQTPGNRLNEAERKRILAIANSEEFGHLPPSQIVPRLADRGEYIASESSFYRVLNAANQLRHRAAEKPAKPRSKPRALSATAPGQLFSWDITYLPTQIKGMYFYLYLFLDIFSRKIVGWQVYDRECSALAGEVMRDICERERIAPDQVVLHSDNGAPMKGATMLATLQMLGVTPSFSRPAVSNDNPYVESIFKTMKYRPQYPHKPFTDLMSARQWVGTFVRWYNDEHRHSAIGFVTPGQRHAGRDAALLARRNVVYEAAKARHPQRWSGLTRNWKPVAIVHLNPEKHTTDTSTIMEEQSTLKQAA